MSNEIATINNNFPTEMELKSVGLIAKTAHISGLYAGVGGEAKIMMILLAAKELGVGPCQALNGGIWAIQGRIEISARLMNGLIRRAGHSIHIVRSDDECCILKGTRKDGDSFEVSFNKEDAIKAGLWGTNTWKKYPGDMLYNRCMSRLGRRLFSDVIGQCYIEGELKEAKEVERLEQAEYEEVKPIATKVDHIESATNLIQESEPKVSKEDLDILIAEYEKTTDQFKENCEKYIATSWNIKEFEELTKKQSNLMISWINKNLQAQVEGAVK